MADPRRGNPLRTFAAAIDALGGPAKKWSQSAETASRSAVGALFLSRETVTLSQAESSWRVAFDAAVQAHARTGSSEARLLAENFPGLVLWRTSLTVDRGSWRADLKRMRDLLAAMTGPDATAALTQNDLRVTAAYGPVNVKSALKEWLAEFEKFAEDISAYRARDLVESGRAGDGGRLPSADSFSARLTDDKYSLIFPFPAVQECLRFLSASVGWLTPFSLLYERTVAPELKPLTRALFAVSFVDQYFWQVKDAPPPKSLRERFRADAEALDGKSLMSPSEANATKRTNYEVRISAAVSYADPFVRAAAPGIANARVRTDPRVLLPDDGPLDREALAVHVPAVLRLIAGGPEGETADAEAARDARLALADSASAALDAVQRAQSPRQLQERLIRAGFTPTACLIYESALRAEFARGRYSAAYAAASTPIVEAPGGDEDTASAGQRRSEAAAFEFGEAQQAVGCVAVIGKAAFALAESYGPGSEYLDSFTFATGADLDDAADFHAALGLPDGAVSGVLGRSMPPRAFPEYVRAARAALLAEVDDSERTAAARSGRNVAARGNSARESLMLWFDRSAQERWGIVQPLAALPAASLSPLSPPGVAPKRGDAATAIRGASSPPAREAAVSPAREAEMIAAAAAVAYPRPAPERAELRSPEFAKYVVATAAADALSALAGASFTAPHIATALDVAAWARDYGGPDVGSFDDHRNKLNGIIYALLPFSGNDPQSPTPADAANVESLLGELHAAVAAAAAALPERARPEPPPRPSAANSAFLLSMYATAARLELDALVARTEALAAAVSAIAWSVADSAWTLKAFFAADFAPSGAGVITVSLPSAADRGADGSVPGAGSSAPGGAEPLGAWRSADLTSAVQEAYADCADAVAEARVFAVNLRALAQDTDRAREACMALAAKAVSERSGAGEPAARVYASLAADHTNLRDVQASLDLSVRKLTAGTTPPGVSAVARDLEFLKTLHAVAAAASDPAALFEAAAAVTATAWKRADDAAEEDAAVEEREEANRRAAPDELSDTPTRSEITAAVRAVTEDVVRLDPGAPSAGAIDISARFNLADAVSLDPLPLVYGAAVPPSAAVYSDELLLKDRVVAEALTDLADAILNSDEPYGVPAFVAAVPQEAKAAA